MRILLGVDRVVWRWNRVSGSWEDISIWAESWAVQTRPGKGNNCSSQGAGVALSGICGCQHIDSYVMAVDILQDSNCAVQQFLAEHISTWGHPRKGDISCHSLKSASDKRSLRLLDLLEMPSGCNCWCKALCVTGRSAAFHNQVDT